MISEFRTCKQFVAKTERVNSKKFYETSEK